MESLANIVNIKTVVAVSFFVALVILFSIPLFVPVQDLKMVDYSTKVDSIRIESLNGSGIRGVIGVQEDLFISSSADVVENPCGYEFNFDGPIVDWSKDGYTNRLADVDFPYTIFKAANSNYFVVIKDSCDLKFILPERYRGG